MPENFYFTGFWLSHLKQTWIVALFFSISHWWIWLHFASVPHANFYVKFNPFCVDFSASTLIWLNSFARRVSKDVVSIRSHIFWFKCAMQFQKHANGKLTNLENSKLGIQLFGYFSLCCKILALVMINLTCSLSKVKFWFRMLHIIRIGFNVGKCEKSCYTIFSWDLTSTKNLPHFDNLGEFMYNLFRKKLLQKEPFDPAVTSICNLLLQLAHVEAQKLNIVDSIERLPFQYCCLKMILIPRLKINCFDC